MNKRGKLLSDYNKNRKINQKISKSLFQLHFKTNFNV